MMALAGAADIGGGLVGSAEAATLNKIQTFSFTLF